MMHKTKETQETPQKASSLSPEDRRILSESIEDNRSLLQKLSKL
ncbi:hypothetical protein [Methanomethylovorans sp.]